MDVDASNIFSGGRDGMVKVSLRDRLRGPISVWQLELFPSRASSAVIDSGLVGSTRFH